MDKFKSEDIRILVGKNIKRLRAQRGISQMTLAAQANLTHNFINEIENGRKWISSDSLAKLAGALDTEPYTLFIPAAIQNNSATEIIKDYLDNINDAFNAKVREIQHLYTADR